MKKVILFILISYSQASFGCGGGWWSEDLYYHLFVQDIGYGLSPFYYYEDGLFNTPWGYEEDIPNRNTQDWITYFNDEIDEKEIEFLIHKASELSLKDHQIAGKDEAFIDYILFARYIDAITERSYDEVWEGKTYEKDLVVVAKGKLIKQIESSNSFFALRYAYQLSKLELAQNNPEGVIDVFENYVKPNKQNQAVYFYARDHYAWANKKYDTERAVAIYVKNFVELPERKISCYNSMRFIENAQYWNSSVQYLDTKEQETALLFLQGFDQQEHPVDIFKTVSDIEIDSKYTHLALARAINHELRNSYPNLFQPFYKIDCENVLELNSESYWLDEQEQYRLDELTRIVEQADGAYYQKALAQIYLLTGQYEQAIKQAKLLMENHPKEQQEAKLIELFAQLELMDKITKKEENFLSKAANTLKTRRTDDDYQSDLETLFYQKVGETYFQQDDRVKAFFSLNSAQELGNYYDRCLLEDMLTFVQKKKHNAFEQILIQKFSSEDPESIIQQYIARTYIMELDFEPASLIYRQFPETISVPDSIFLTTTKQCFECEFGEIVADIQQTSLSGIRYTSVSELLKDLIELKQTAQTNPENALKLGNSLFNIGRRGYFRDLFSDGEHGYNRSFTINHLTNPYASYHPLDYQHAQSYFQLVLDSTHATEAQKLEAAWGYLLAKQGAFEDETRESNYGYFWDVNYSDEDLMDFFSKTQAEYARLDEFSNQEFYQEIIQECGFISNPYRLP